MTSRQGSASHIVVYDPDAVAEFVTAVKAKEEHRSILNAALKLRELGEHLRPPHMKPLQGATALRELRPRQGRSDWRAIYRRSGSVYVVLAIDRHKNFAAMIARAEERSPRYGASSLNLDQS